MKYACMNSTYFFDDDFALDASCLNLDPTDNRYWVRMIYKLLSEFIGSKLEA